MLYLLSFHVVGSGEVDLAIKYLEYLTMVPRFDLVIMCLSLADKAGMF